MNIASLSVLFLSAASGKVTLARSALFVKLTVYTNVLGSWFAKYSSAAAFETLFEFFRGI